MSLDSKAYFLLRGKNAAEVSIPPFRTNYSSEVITDLPMVSEIVPGLWQGGVADGVRVPDSVRHVVSLHPWDRFETGSAVISELYVKAIDNPEQGFGPLELAASHAAEVFASGTGDVLIHCQAGLNRSSVVTSLVLAQVAGGLRGTYLIDLIRRQRSKHCLSNPAFEAYVRAL